MQKVAVLVVCLKPLCTKQMRNWQIIIIEAPKYDRKGGDEMDGVRLGESVERVGERGKKEHEEVGSPPSPKSQQQQQ